jgi:hypothetical protein
MVTRRKLFCAEAGTRLSRWSGKEREKEETYYEWLIQDHPVQ